MSNGAPSIDALAGRYVLHPGQAQPIQGGRPVLAPEVLHRLARGKSAEMLPALLGSVFSLCGQAHRIAAGSAVRAAQGDTRPLGAPLRERLLAETAREHLQRMALDWPRRAQATPASPAWLAGCPLLTHPDAPGDALARLASWLQQNLLGQDAEAWLDDWRRDGETALERWAARQAPQHPVARLLHDLRPAAQALAPHPLPWQPLDDAAATPSRMAWLALQMQHPDFIQRPQWQGRPAETGPWTRLAQPMAAHNAWMRLASRLVDLVRLACPGAAPQADVLAHGASTCAPREGIAWVEMARGLLVHWVRLDERQRVDDLRVLAPTEWNLHPQGVLAQALSALPAHDPKSLASARLLVTAFDPCVDFEILAAEPGHA